MLTDDTVSSDLPVITPKIVRNNTIPIPSLNNDSPNSFTSICCGAGVPLLAISLNTAIAAGGSVGDKIAPSNKQ